MLVSFVRRLKAGAPHLSPHLSPEQHFCCLYLEDQSPVLRPAAGWVPFVELLTNLWGIVEGPDKCSHDQAFHLLDESTLNLPEKALGQRDGGSECRAVSQWLLTSSLAPFLKPALVRKGPLGASCFYGFKTRASEEGPSMKKKRQIKSE